MISKGKFYSPYTGLYTAIVDFCMNYYTRDQLREMAKTLKIKHGRNKRDTLTNLLKSGKIDVSLRLIERK